jgi:hypothetical protein
LRDAIHQNNLLKMEMEETLKQVDVADTKATDRDEEIKLIKAEYEHKVKLAENRALYRE